MDLFGLLCHFRLLVESFLLSRASRRIDTAVRAVFDKWECGEVGLGRSDGHTPDNGEIGATCGVPNSIWSSPTRSGKNPGG
jgi:hypothetical protein